MAMYYCHPCGKYVDDDWHPGEESLKDGELICPDCFAQEEIEAEEADDIPWGQAIKKATVGGRWR